MAVADDVKHADEEDDLGYGRLTDDEEPDEEDKEDVDIEDVQLRAEDGEDKSQDDTGSSVVFSSSLRRRHCLSQSYGTEREHK